MQGVFLDLESVDRGDLDRSALELALPHWQWHDHTAPEKTAGRIFEAGVVVSNKVWLGAAELDSAPGLRLILIAATGTNNVDLEAAQAREVTVCNVRGYATPSVVQLVFAMMLGLTTRLEEYHRAVMDGRWARSRQFCLLDCPIRELAGRRLGIIGYGELGRAVASVAQALGMEVLLAQRPGGPPREGRLPLDRLLGEVDVLSLHCPLTKQTRGLIGAAELARMPTGALLINAARGGIVDEQALADALRSGHIGGAGVDVLSAEPAADGNPLLVPGIPNLIVTPHVAWASREARQRLVDGLAENLRAFLDGQPIHQV